MRPSSLLSFFLTFLALLVMTGCMTLPSPETEIRSRLASIRTAILARNADGIVHWGTPDWTLVAADGTSHTRDSYLVRARALFERIEKVDSLETAVDRLDVRGDTAEMEITQTMVRHERDAATARRLHLRLRYRERQTWVKTADGWRVRQVLFLGQPERTELPAS